MHIPPGMNAYNSSHGECQQPVSFWQARYTTEFSTLMSTYSDVVHLAFAGHIHMDDFRVSVAGPPSLPMRLTPSVSPIFRNNPSFSVMTYDLATAAVSDITTYFLALSSGTPSWSKEYQLSSAYHTGSFSADNLSAIAAAISNGGSARAVFENNYAASSPSPINASNFPFYSCAHTHFTPTSYRDCVCGAASNPPKESAPR
jgi:sphingomyelin phosphodiesterase acid-like 3